MFRILMSALMAAGLVALPHAAVADSCGDAIAALFAEGGANDAFARPPHVQHTLQLLADGSVAARSGARVQDPLHTIADIGGSCTLVAGADYWTGACWDGPWTKGPTQLPADRDQALRARLAQEAAHVTEAECLGPVTLEDGRAALGYRYRTQTDPDPQGRFEGALHTVYVDPDRPLWLQWETTEAVTPWAPEPGSGTMVTTIVYDDSVSVTAPAE